MIRVQCDQCKTQLTNNLVTDELYCAKCYIANVDDLEDAETREKHLQAKLKKYEGALEKIADECSDPHTQPEWVMKVALEALTQARKERSRLNEDKRP